jgi:hypothetical protein
LQPAFFWLMEIEQVDLRPAGYLFILYIIGVIKIIL